MAIDIGILNTRYGLGFGPGRALARAPEDLLGPLAGPDAMAARFPIAPYAALQEITTEIRALRREANEAPRDARGPMREAERTLRRGEAQRRVRNLALTVARMVETDDPMRERLTAFWADHFTTRPRGVGTAASVSMYVEEAIRPHMTGRFADLLKAAIVHPQMIRYLEQDSSVGDNSKRAARARRRRGLNENLGRELLELHTLGVDGPYDQADVRELAELLAGLRGTPWDGLSFDEASAEPGAETVLGTRYGGGAPGLDDIYTVLDDLAAHPATARHLAWKLAVHFVAMEPAPELVDHVAARYRETDGDLMASYAALMEHPAGRAPERAKVKPPLEWMATSLRALGAPGDLLAEMPAKQVNAFLQGPLRQMGHAWANPSGPDGLAEAPEDWITPQMLAARIRWATRRRNFSAFDPPRPEAFAEIALGPLLTERVRFAARSAETQREGIALVLLSPEFQRR